MIMVAFQGEEYDLDTSVPLQYAIDRAIGECHRIDREINLEALSLKDKMDRVIRYLNEGLGLNELGEIQSRGLSFDLLVAKRAQLYREVVRLLWVHDRQIAEAAAAEPE
jgi:hypothetical protein